jgi:hypothetical protein
MFSMGRLMRLARTLLVLAATAALFTPRPALADDATPGAAAVPDDRARFSASFRFAGSSGEEAARRAAIDRCIDSLFFAIRGIARSRLSDGTKIDPWVAFSFDAEKVSVRHASVTHTSPANGATVDYVSGSDRTKLSQRLSSGKITQVFIAGEGRRTNESLLSPDARTLVLTVTVASPKLTRPVVYTLTYERAR